MTHLAWISLIAPAVCAIPITVTDQKGRAIEIELISVAGESVTFSRKGDTREFTLPMSQFAESSRLIIRKQAELLPAAIPKVAANVSIGKRRDKYNYYMTKQTITCTIKLTNQDAKAAVPTMSGQIVFLGQNRRAPEILNILSTQTFTASLDRAGNATREMEAFKTAYDSDNKGTGNIGGFAYFGYILALKDKDGKIVFNQTSGGKLALALKDKSQLLEDVLAYSDGKQLTDKLEPSKTRLSTYRAPY